MQGFMGSGRDPLLSDAERRARNNATAGMTTEQVDAYTAAQERNAPRIYDLGSRQAASVFAGGQSYPAQQQPLAQQTAWGQQAPSWANVAGVMSAPYVQQRSQWDPGFQQWGQQAASGVFGQSNLPSWWSQLFGGQGQQTTPTAPFAPSTQRGPAKSPWGDGGPTSGGTLVEAPGGVPSSVGPGGENPNPSVFDWDPTNLGMRY